MLSKITSWRHSKIIAFVLAVAVFLTAFYGITPVISFAEATEPAQQATGGTWDGDKTYDYTEMEGDGTEDNPYKVYNGAQLYAAVNCADGKSFVVMNDIVLNNTVDFDTWDDNSPYVDWTSYAEFKGTFDGNGKTISGLYVSADIADSNDGQKPFSGLFYKVGSNSSIYNIVLEKAYISQTDTASTWNRVGGIVGSIVSASNVNIFGCVVKDSKIYNRSTVNGYAGGILGGSNNSTIAITNCIVVDTVLSANKIAGVFSGNNWTNTVTLSNCFATDYALAKDGDATLNNCYVGDVDIDKNDMKGEAALTNMKLSASEWNATDDYPQPKTRSQVCQYFKPQDKDTNAINFAGGDGTKEKPYQITNAAQLFKAVNNTVAGKYFKVMNDIVVNDASSFDTWNDSYVFTDWTPNATFVGTFDGNGKTISGLYVSADFTGSAHGGFGGLFYMLGTGANIYNVVLENAYISQTSTAGAWSRVGGIVGSIVSASNVNIFGCVVRNSKIYNKASANGFVGGILGGSHGSTVAITNCSVVDTVLSANKVAGLFSGNNWGNTVTLSNCFATDYALAKDGDATLNNCYVGGVDIDKADMKDQAALTNMNLSIFEWVAEAENYPTPVLYTTVNAFIEADKNTGSTNFAGGDGTKNDPYQITNAAQLFKAVNNTDSSLYFKVMNDISVNSVSYFDAWNNQSNRTNWTPTAEFTGTFDGNGKTISGLYSVGSTSNALGLFSKLGSNATIYNVIVDKAYFVYTATSVSYVGGLVGRAYNTNDVSITGCVVKNSKLGNNSTSGDGTLAGFIGAAHANAADQGYSVTIENCYAVDNVLLTREGSEGEYAKYTAGFVGLYWGSTVSIKNCFTTGGYSFATINSTYLSFTNCYSDGEYPFAQKPDIIFAWVTGIDQLSSDEMKGEEAVTNMNLPVLNWVPDDESYPTPVLYTTVNAFTEADKDIAQIIFEGEGTESSPYKITNAAQLFAAVNNTDAAKHYKVMNDITINSTALFDAWDDNTPATDWTPNATFVGTFDGNGKTISGLYVSADFTGSSHGGFGGLFYMLGTGANIYNVVLENAYISQTSTAGTWSRVGGIVGSIVSASNVNIFGCVVKNSKIYNKASANGYVGGILGGLHGSTVAITNCSVVDTVLSANKVAGLFSGNNWSHTVTLSNCFVTDYVLTLESGITTNNCYVGGVDIDKNDMKGVAALTNMKLSASEWNATTNDYPQPKTRSQIWQYFKPQDKDTNAINYAGGYGTENSPYQITNAAQLFKAVNNTEAGKYFKVMNDIVINDALSFDTWHDSYVFTDWTPNATFVGTFDGNGKTISGLYVSADFTGSTHGGFGGLFYEVGTGANIYNIVLEKAYISQTQTDTTARFSRVGGIVGRLNGATNVSIYGCVVKNSKLYNKSSANGYVGGILGGLGGSTVDITNCSVVDTVLSGTHVAGLFSGNNWSHTVTLSNCFVTDYVLTLESGITTNNCYVGGVDIDKADMKDQAALANMNLSALEWNAIADDYPQPKTRSQIWQYFKPQDKDTDAINYAGGYGTEKNPYQITNAAQLFKAVNNTEAGKYFKVMNDIVVNDVSSFEEWNNNLIFVDWDPTNKFTGTFDGNGKTISGLYAATSTSNSLGLFSQLDSNATVYNVIVDKAYFVYTATSLAYVGGLVGRAYNTNDVSITGCVVKNSKLGNNSGSGDGTLAGFIGAAHASAADPGYSVTIENCYAVDNVLLTREGSEGEYAKYTAGFVGLYWGSTVSIKNCFTTGGYSFATINSSYLSFTNCYSDGEYPFAQKPDIIFAWVTGIDHLSSDEMKGATAYDKMSLSPAHGWVVETADSYPKYVGSENVDDYKYLTPIWNGNTQLEPSDLAVDASDATTYYISTGSELYAALKNTESGKVFSIMNDIYLNNDGADSLYWNIPAVEFNGTINGNDYTVYGMKNTTAAALIPQADTVVINNLHLRDSMIDTSADVAGALVGSATTATITGCSVKDTTVTAAGTAAGLVGNATTATISNSVFAGVGALIGNITAGLVGSDNATLTNCISQGYMPTTANTVSGTNVFATDVTNAYGAYATTVEFKASLTEDQIDALSEYFYWDNFSDNAPLLKSRKATPANDIDGDEVETQADAVALKGIILYNSNSQLKKDNYNSVDEIDITDVVFLAKDMNPLFNCGTPTHGTALSWAKQYGTEMTWGEDYSVDSDLMVVTVQPSALTGVYSLLHETTSPNTGAHAYLDFANNKVGLKGFDRDTSDVAVLVEKDFTFVEGRKYDIQHTVIGGHEITMTVTDTVTKDSVTVQYLGDNNAAYYSRSLGTHTDSCTDDSVQVISKKLYSLQPRETQALIMGDSFVAGFYRTRYGTLIKNDLNGSAFISGVSGGKTVQIQAMLQYLPELCNPRYVVLAIGTNHNNGDYDSWKVAMEDIISTIKTEWSEAQIILCTVTLRSGNSDNENQSFVIEANEWIRNSGYKYVDVNKLTTVGGDMQTQDLSKFQGDKVHLNAAANTEVYNEFKKVVPELFK